MSTATRAVMTKFADTSRNTENSSVKHLFLWSTIPASVWRLILGTSPWSWERVAVLLTTWSHSNFRFGTAFPSEKLECVLTGLVRAFEFFVCVPRELWWDNPKTVVQEIFKGRKRQMHPRYAALASHYMFEPLLA